MARPALGRRAAARGRPARWNPQKAPAASRAGGTSGRSPPRGVRRHQPWCPGESRVPRPGLRGGYTMRRCCHRGATAGHVDLAQAHETATARSPEPGPAWSPLMGEHMFFVTYLRRELRRRKRQAVFIALGLALGIGLVVTVIATSAGVRQAQAAVLRGLYGVGTDVTVTGAPPGPPKAGSARPRTRRRSRSARRARSCAATGSATTRRARPSTTWARSTRRSTRRPWPRWRSCTAWRRPRAGWRSPTARSRSRRTSASREARCPSRRASPSTAWTSRTPRSARSARRRSPPVTPSPGPSPTPTSRWWTPATRPATS